MVLLSKEHLIRMVKSNQLIIDPFDEEAVQEAYIELKLGNKFTALLPTDKGYLDSERRHTPLKQKDMLEGEPPIITKQKYDIITISDDSKFMVEKHEYILGTTKEFIVIPEGYIGILKGKSSLGRLGIQVFCSGGYIDPKFKGNLVLEIFNANKVPVALHPGMAIAKLAIMPISKPHIKESKVAPEVFDHKEIEDLAQWVTEKAAKEET